MSILIKKIMIYLNRHFLFIVLAIAGEQAFGVFNNGIVDIKEALVHKNHDDCTCHRFSC